MESTEPSLILKAQWADDGIIYLIDRLLFGGAEAQILALTALYNRRRAWCDDHPSLPFRGTIRFDLGEIQRFRSELLERMRRIPALAPDRDLIRSSFLLLLERLDRPGASFAAADVLCSAHDNASMAWAEYAAAELLPLAAEFSRADWDSLLVAWPLRPDSWRKNILGGFAKKDLPDEVRVMLQLFKVTCADEDLVWQIDVLIL